jgi:hypothetical protein
MACICLASRQAPAGCQKLITGVVSDQTDSTQRLARTRLADMTKSETRIVLRQAGEMSDPIVHHPGQPEDYSHTDGTNWTWEERWRIVGGVPLRLYTPVKDATFSSNTDAS